MPTGYTSFIENGTVKYAKGEVQNLYTHSIKLEEMNYENQHYISSNLMNLCFIYLRKISINIVVVNKH